MSGETNFDREVEANFRWNFSVNLLDIAFIMFGLNLVSQATIMPVLVSQLTTSKVAIGLIPAIYSLGYLLPQLLTASFAERLLYKKPFVMLLGGLGERGPFLLIGLAVWGLAGPSPTAALVAFFLLLAISAISNGMATPAWYDLIAKVIPVHKRGLWSGVANSLGAFLGIAGAGLAGSRLRASPTQEMAIAAKARRKHRPKFWGKGQPARMPPASAAPAMPRKAPRLLATPDHRPRL